MKILVYKVEWVSSCMFGLLGKRAALCRFFEFDYIRLKLKFRACF